MYKLIFVHVIPCFLLTLFTIALFCKLRWQDSKRAKLLHPDDDDEMDKKKKEDTATTSTSENVSVVQETRELTAVEVMRSATNGDVTALDSIQFIDEGVELGEYEVLINIENVEEGVERKKSFLDGLVEVVPPVIHEVIDEEVLGIPEVHEIHHSNEYKDRPIQRTHEEAIEGVQEVKEEIEIVKEEVVQSTVVHPPIIVVTPPMVVDDDAIELLGSEDMVVPAAERTVEQEIEIVVEEIIVKVVAKVEGEQKPAKPANDDWAKYMVWFYMKMEYNMGSFQRSRSRGSTPSPNGANATEPGERPPLKSYAGSSKFLFIIVIIHLLVELPVIYGVI